MIEQHYSCKQVGQKLGVSHVTVWQAIQDGRLGAVSFGHRWLIPESAVQAYLDSHRIGPALPKRSATQNTVTLPKPKQK